MFDKARQRERQDATRAAVERLPGRNPTAHQAQVCQTVAMPGGTYPSTAGKYYGVQPLRESGLEEEGEAVEYDNRAAPFLAAHLGSAVPPQGTKVLVVFCSKVGYLFEY